MVVILFVKCGLLVLGLSTRFFGPPSWTSSDLDHCIRKEKYIYTWLPLTSKDIHAYIYLSFGSIYTCIYRLELKKSLIISSSSFSFFGKKHVYMIKWFAFRILTSHCFIQSKYLILAPWAVHSIYSFLFKEESKRDLSNFFILPLLLWRMLHNQIWISISRYQNAKGNNLVVDRSLQFEQVDREQSWLVLILFLYTHKHFFFFFS